MRDSIALERTPEGRRLVISRRIDAPATRVWELFVDTDQWPAWGPTVRGVETDTRRIQEGTTGRVRTVAGPWLPFTVTRVGDMAWAWRIGPVPATGHRVRPASTGCRAAFEVPLWAAPYVFVCWVALRRIESLATDGTGR